MSRARATAFDLAAADAFAAEFDEFRLHGRFQKPPLRVKLPDFLCAELRAGVRERVVRLNRDRRHQLRGLLEQVAAQLDFGDFRLIAMGDVED